MDITDAFATENIQAAGAVLAEEEAKELRTFLLSYFKERDGENPDEAPNLLWADIAIHAFMAGRAWQHEQGDEASDTVPVHMNLMTTAAFIEFLQAGEMI